MSDNVFSFNLEHQMWCCAVEVGAARASADPRYSDATNERLRECEKHFKIAAAMIQEVNLLLTSEDAEDDFLRRWDKEVTPLLK